MQEDDPFGLNKSEDSQEIFGMMPIVLEDPPITIYAIGWSDFGACLQKFNKTLLSRIIKENNKIQSSKSKKGKGLSSPEVSRDSEDSFIDIVESELFDRNLTTLIADLDWNEVAERLSESLQIDQLQNSSICKIWII